MLLQKDSGNKLVPVAYESWKLIGPKVNFNQYERERLAAMWLVQRFEGLTEMTHHSPLKYILSGKSTGSKVPNTRIAQWALFLIRWGVGHETQSKIDLLPYVLLIEGTKHECPDTDPCQGGTGVTEAPPLEENSAVQNHPT